MYRFVINPKYMNMIITLKAEKEQNLRNLSKKFDFNYGHLSNVMSQLFREGIISKDTQHNIIFGLTPKGLKIADCLINLKSAIESKEVPNYPASNIPKKTLEAAKKTKPVKGLVYTADDAKEEKKDGTQKDRAGPTSKKVQS